MPLKKENNNDSIKNKFQLKLHNLQNINLKALQPASETATYLTCAIHFYLTLKASKTGCVSCTYCPGLEMSGDIQMRRQPGGGLKLKNNRKKRPEQALQDPSVASFAGMGEISFIKAMCSTGPASPTAQSR